MVKQIVGDLIKSAKNGEFDVIAHQCNCFNTMGSGIAFSIKKEWPEAAQVDAATVKGDISKLGTITYTKNTNPIIVNLYGQFDYWSNGVLTDYDALLKALTEMKQNFPGKKIGMPKIGSLRARGDWSVILPIIEKVFSDPTDDVTIVEWVEDVKNTVTSNNQTSSTPSNTNYGNQTGAITKLSAFQPSTQPVSKTFQSQSNSTLMTTPSNVVQKKKFRGTRKCKVCNTSHSVREMHNYFHSVWVCKDKCHQEFQNRINQINTLESIRIITSSNQSNVPSPILSNESGS